MTLESGKYWIAEEVLSQFCVGGFVEITSKLGLIMARGQIKKIAFDEQERKAAIRLKFCFKRWLGKWKNNIKTEYILELSRCVVLNRPNAIVIRTANGKKFIFYRCDDSPL